MDFKKLSIFYGYRGRVCLSMVLQAAGVKKGDYVACQSFTCVAVPEAIISIGARPLFIDTENAFVNLSLDDLEKKISKNKLVKAVVIQHTYGIKFSSKKISFLKNKYNITFIEDCCHLPFDIHNFENEEDEFIKFYSFEWGKPFPLGIGGALLIKNKKIAEACKKLEKNFKNPPLLNILKIELQYYVFQYFYSPSNYFLLKKLFHLFNKLGFSISNKSENNNFLSNQEYSWKISPFVKKRIQSLNESKKFFLLRHNKKILKIFSNNLNLKDKIIEKNYEEFLMRYPIIVKNKIELLKFAEKNNLEISGWYKKPVDPLSIQDCQKLGWNIKSCSNSIINAETIVTLPLNLKTSLSDAERISRQINIFLNKD